MVKTRTKYIGYGTSIVTLILFFFYSTNFDIQVDGDVICDGSFEEPCEAHFNVTSINYRYYLYNSKGVDLNFVPNVKESYICKRDNRFTASKRANREEYPCGIGWREFDFRTPLTSRYKYVERFERGKKHEYKIVVFKFHIEDEIKWGGRITGEDIDPKFIPPYTTTRSCVTEREKVTVYGLVEYTRTIYSEGILYYNETFCDDFPTNLSCSKRASHTQNYKIPEEEIYYVNETVGSIIAYDNNSNCRTTSITTNGVRLVCSVGFRCDIIGDEFCALDCGDGDCNFNAKDHQEKGWSRSCEKIDDLKVGEFKVSSHKRGLQIEKV